MLDAVLLFMEVSDQDVYIALMFKDGFVLNEVFSFRMCEMSC